MKKLILLTLLISYTARPCDDGIVKNNSLQIPVNSLLSNDITEAEFKGTIKKFEDFFAPGIDETLKSELIIYKSWSSNTVNAFAEKAPRKIMITVYGGLARHKSMTTDSLMLTLCHELGHHFGGFPKKPGNTWSSAEGQADYYSTTKCLRRIWEKDDNLALMSKVAIPAVVRQECAETFKTDNEVALCARMSLAGKAMALLFQDLDHDSLEPKFETPEPEIAASMQYLHPFSQCRLDTYFQGAICSVPESVDFDDRDQTVGSCNKKHGFSRGLRPACWFKSRY